jgi:hypothetical protein
MHLPEELVRMIREFSKPLLRYPREYKLALAATNRTSWYYLRKKLSSPEADQVIVLLRCYLESMVQNQTFRDIFKAKVFNPACELCEEERRKIQTDWINSIANEQRHRNMLECFL